MPKARDRATGLSVLVASTAFLALEVAQVRIFSYSLDPLFVFCAISIALLGLGAGSVAVALRPELARGAIASRLVFTLAGFSASTVVVHALFARTSARISADGSPLLAALLLSTLVLPYFFAGLFLSVVMAKRAEDIGRIYFFNLVGSGFGCVIVYPLLRPLGVEAIVAGCAAATAITAAFLAWSTGKLQRTLASAIALASVGALPFAASLFPFEPDPRDLYGMARDALVAEDPGARPEREHASWDPISRVEVHAFPGRFGKVNDRAPMRFFVQDGGAGSALFDLRGHDDLRRVVFEGTVYGAAYMLRPDPPERVLIIGLGGAPDVHAALHYGAKEIVGVEINQSTIDVVGEVYADFVGNPYGHPNVTVIHGDGRSFVERSQERFDLIQMSGADTLAAGASGAFMFSESYLYTREAFAKYWERLDDDGILAIIRFLIEPARIVATGVDLLRQQGIAHPERHFVVLQQGISVSVLLSKRELTPADVARIQDRVAYANTQIERLRIPLYEVIGFGFEKPIDLLYAPGVATPGPLQDYFQAVARNDERRFLASLPFDVSPVTDDRPFFFQFFKLQHLRAMLFDDKAFAFVGGFRMHLKFLGLVTAIAAAMLLAPVALRRRSPALAVASPSGPQIEVSAQAQSLGSPRALVYFAALGFGYLFVELTLMQKTALFLGHPTYSIATTLLSLLVASGLGSLFAARLSTPPAKLVRIAALAVVVLLVAEHLVLAHAFPALLPAPFAVRLLVVAVAMAPLGFVMGIPFPTGLRIAASRGESALAFGLAINGFASVLASLIGIPIAMFFGFTSVVAIAALLYATAAIVQPR